jgi:hypothetical protein
MLCRAVGASACGLGPLFVAVRGSSALGDVLLRWADGSNPTLSAKVRLKGRSQFPAVDAIVEALQTVRSAVRVP